MPVICHAFYYSTNIFFHLLKLCDIILDCFTIFFIIFLMIKVIIFSIERLRYHPHHNPPHHNYHHHHWLSTFISINIFIIINFEQPYSTEQRISCTSVLTLMLLVANTKGQYKRMQKTWKITETLTCRYSSESTLGELSNEYPHDFVKRIFMYLFIFVHTRMELNPNYYKPCCNIVSHGDHKEELEHFS